MRRTWVTVTLNFAAATPGWEFAVLLCIYSCCWKAQHTAPERPPIPQPHTSGPEGAVKSLSEEQINELSSLRKAGSQVSSFPQRNETD